MKDEHIFVTELNDGNNLNFKISEEDLLADLKVLIKEYYAATFEADGKKLKLCFNNGQKFSITVAEIN